ncbi:hypothetical protein [Mucilaginibacter glaciei]|uniref:Uncharacterized protein n=1 Tax=Mucilaginibacter glaciei TaxID=2772109 RepID=A0A926S541_9SPHI|nr:hypothetical protein [Mucilaginibacter glaciei]MBD1392381.1 hypothetical protein [Mucilaginibacter glaciei]
MRVNEIADILIGLLLIVSGAGAFLYILKQATNEAKSNKQYLWFSLAAVALLLMGLAAIYEGVETTIS